MIAANSLVLGQQVAIGQHFNYTRLWQGVYTVTKVNRMQAVLTRDSDAYERVWSVKRNQVLPSRPGGYVDRDLFMDTVQAMTSDQAASKKIAQVDALWVQLSKAAAQQDRTAALATLTLIMA